MNNPPDRREVSHGPRHSKQPPTGPTPYLKPHTEELDDWVAWLNLSTTPPTHACTDPLHKLHIHGGTITAPQDWPITVGARIYVAYDHRGAVYVGQTNRLLITRIRHHFGNQSTTQQQLKAGSWEFVVTGLFDGIGPGVLDRCERQAAEWLLDHRHRQGRRHPPSS